MRYIADENGYLKEVSLGADIYCEGQVCTEYIGDVPEGYDSLTDWFVLECDKLHRWHIVEGQLTLDESAADPPMPALGIPIYMTKVWENKDPSQAISTEALEVDLTDFQMVAIEYRFNTTYDRRKMAFGVVGTTVTLDVISTSFYLGTRQCDISAGGVNVGAASYSANGSSIDPDDYMIPTRIFGIKGVFGLAGNTETSAICGAFLCGGAVCGQ